MTINVRFFASLRERLGLERTEIQPDGISDVRSVWQAVSDLPLDEELLVAVNRNYASLEQAVEDGDEVAFFPPVTGG
ncbi:MAG: molybdopterin synthase sulfur carrier subunit [Pseudomonadota bacterium]|jgi:molybdopterin synthase sulfur carrier subunit|nr:MAG: molybdopterin synthase sulfur carrier subunit [Pseudomonadota bacterium]